ncbi:hypothetical protein EX30DRAFT_343812 [Ascodesmis nigricans]|uniref:Uncharacterized protein n=1 Tax=Ascodesmis nigricans TaxID=341454 RepID=A0A4S2ML31_9PEZI|nr:hypothetical protein EX30DRAFT_343812 [Ascodesmis nigricans]
MDGERVCTRVNRQQKRQRRHGSWDGRLMGWKWAEKNHSGREKGCSNDDRRAAVSGVDTEQDSTIDESLRV